jgi:ribosomal protein S18 acetylase RimI-like enzyme
MTSYKLLIDTNVFIGLEDSKLVDSGFAEFNRRCAQHGVRLFVHEAALDDIKRDKDANRRQISLSKLQKFENISGIKLPPRAALEVQFGSIHRPNDEVDISLLVALDRGAVDFLITQDQGIHDRVRSSLLSKRVFRISDALTWLRQTFEPAEVKLPFVVQRKAHEIELSDSIFDSLRDGYNEFDRWWQEKCVRQHRACWVVEIGHELAGICVRKDETRLDATVMRPGNKILKLCTFKVKPQYRGEKLGELLLKQALWFAQQNQYDLLYVTTKPEQTYLIQILEYFGFEHTTTLDLDERVYEKPLSTKRLTADASADIFKLDRTNYPRFVADRSVTAYYVPIRGGYHRKLFPEIAVQVALPLFPDQKLFQAGGMQERTPGNTIRKVYLCRAKAGDFKAGDLLFFYESRSKDFLASQSITSVGVLEAVNITRDYDELVRLTAKRSVFSETELKGLLAESDTPLKVLDFLLVGHYDPPIPLQELVKMRVLSKPPQSIARIAHDKAVALLARLALGFEV